MHYDIIVIGSGPAGLSAALTARARNKTVLVVGNRWQDSPLARAERVDNYLGLPNQSGADLLETFHAHAKEAGVALLEGRALSALPWNGFQVSVGSQVLSAGALILAPGVVRQKKFPGEAEYLGRGVSYCATCDGMLYRGKPVAVVGRSPDAPEEANFLKNLGCQVTYLAPKRPEALDADIPFVQTGTVSIQGQLTVTGLTANGESIPCAGVFILRPHGPAADPGHRQRGHPSRPQHGHQSPRRVRRRGLHRRPLPDRQSRRRGPGRSPVRLRLPGRPGPPDHLTPKAKPPAPSQTGTRRRGFCIQRRMLQSSTKSAKIKRPCQKGRKEALLRKVVG